MTTPAFVAASRRRDLLLTLVMVGIVLTPAWLLPAPFATPWLVLGLVFAVPAVWVSWRYAPWLPTPIGALPQILQHLQLAPEQRFCDLGAGDGRLVVRVQAATGAWCTGIELTPSWWLVARARLALQGNERTSVRFGDLFAADLSEFDVVFVWGTAYLVSTERFARHVRASMRRGARLVSVHHPVPGLAPSTVDEGGPRPVFVYEMPASQNAAAVDSRSS